MSADPAIPATPASEPLPPAIPPSDPIPPAVPLSQEMPKPADLPNVPAPEQPVYAQPYPSYAPVPPNQYPSQVAPQKGKKNPIKLILVLLAMLVLILAGAAGWYEYVQEKAAHEITSNNLAQRVTEVTGLKDKITANNDQITQLNSKVSDLQTKNATLNEDLTASRQKISSYSNQVDQLNKVVNCGFTMPNKIDFTSNETVSDSLKEMIGDMDSTVTDSTWKVIGNGTRTSLQMFGTYDSFYIFVVYFNEDSKDGANSIFFVNGECFLDLSNN
jgi:hypothetical protein